ncbi:hypothetical protein IE81DRAFT_321000 [Ceraceosorus guamensis]|uniref:HSF-type DNA-binding domain-containing protein n=1 Tax=Ceraceosorus guamensis TaxID=1522189 RepID=A0A316W4P1_9BASI|nr:hypothetical protein IE81DRAFT_321000 [Ceraceosorus guamensis]PWN44692.1 hypothetical protein IE81DRAFT_321000 [Ceraceosorus guamensis]
MAALPPAQRASARSPQRQTGFRVPSPNHTDSDMLDAESEKASEQVRGRPQPLAIPRPSAPTSNMKGSMEEPGTSHTSEISTPPDGVGLALDRREVASNAKISSEWSDRVPVTAAQSVSSASSLEPSSWTLSGSQQHSRTFGAISGANANGAKNGLGASSDGKHRLAPYLSTSFRTSAERRGGGAEEDEMEVDEGDDVFGWSARSGAGQHDRDERLSSAQLARGESQQSIASASGGTSRISEGDDAAGVFSFSSPHFGPRSLDANPDAIGSHRSPPSPQLATSSRGDQRLMSPGWAATNLARMSLGGASQGTPDRVSTSFIEAPYEASIGPARSARSSAFSPRLAPNNILPGGAVSLSSSLTHGHGRKSSTGRRPPLSFTSTSGPGISHSFSHVHGVSTPPSSASAQTSARALSATYGRSRSRSRQRPSFGHGADQPGSERAASAAPSRALEDDDATDDEMFDLDDNNEGYGAASQATIRGRRPGDAPEGPPGLPTLWSRPESHTQRGISPQRRHPVTTMSASYERAGAHMAAGAGSGGTALARGYSNDRHHPGYPSGSFSLSRHHPYATSPGPSSFGTSHGHSSAYPTQLASPGLTGISRPSQVRGSSGAGAHYAPSVNSYTASPHLAGNTALPPLYNFTDGDSHAAAQPLDAGQRAAHSASSSRSVLSTSASSHESGASTGMGTSPGIGIAAQRSAPRNVAAAGPPRDPSDAQHLAKASPSTRLSTSAGAAAAGETPEMAEVTAIRERLGGAANCSAFISKLWYLMCRPELYSAYLRWSEAGDSIILFSDQDIANDFASDVLPRLFKHGNNASFVRQLNLYGFQRVPSSRLLDGVEHKVAKRPGGLKGVSNISTALQYYGPHSSFSHPRFLRDREDLLTSMKPRSSKKPKKSNGSNASAGGVGGDDDEE